MRLFNRKKNALIDVWQIDNKNAFIIEMNNIICKKCNYGDELGLLNQAEKVFYVTQQLEMEVNNGGFSQFLFNSSGNVANDLIYSFNEIGALKTAVICQKALSIFDKEIPVSRDDRNLMIDSMMNDKLEGILSECDNQFYEYVDDLETLNYEYIMKNKEYFI